MKDIFLNRKLILAALTLFIFVFAIQITEPANAAKTKLVYTKTYQTYNKQYDLKSTYSLKIYSKGKDALMVDYTKQTSRGYISYYYFKYKIKKVSKNKITISVYEKNHPKAKYLFIKTIKKKWKKSALQYAKYCYHV